MSAASLSSKPATNYFFAPTWLHQMRVERDSQKILRALIIPSCSREFYSVDFLIEVALVHLNGVSGTLY